MRRLHYAPGAASFVVHWLLIELGIPHELRRLDLAAGDQKRPDYLALNPSGVVPTLVVDGEARTEALAIAMQLADEHPGAALAPAPGTAGRARYYAWCVHLANVLQPLFRQWWYPHEPAGEAQADAVRAHAAPRIEAIWDRIDAHLAAQGPYLLGDARCVADFHLVMLMRWSRNMPRPATDWPALAALAGRMKALPSFATLYAREGLDEWA